MSSKIDNYAGLYQEKIQEAEWYKKPAVRTTFKTAGTITIIALIVIASISAYALSSSLSSVGTIGHNLLGSQGLIAATAAGFTGSVVLSVVLIVYLRKSIFRVSDYIHKDKGFLYEIKDGTQTVKGYLYGTVHIMPHHWQGLNDQIQGKLEECKKFIVECHDIPEGAGKKNIFKPFKQGADFEIMAYARQRDAIELEQFETFEEQSECLQSLGIAVIQDTIDNFSCSSCCSGSRSSMSIEERIDRAITTWQTGDKRSISNLLISMTNGARPDELGARLKEALTLFLHGRNTTWMEKIKSELQEAGEHPCFIAVGCAHLFDFNEIDTTGLITQIRTAGWSIERVES